MHEQTTTATHHVFHLYNRSNDRQTLFVDHFNYAYFLRKATDAFRGAAHLVGYCIMPNHFHFLIVPKHPVLVDLTPTNKVLPRLPTDEISEAIRILLMGFTKGYNKTFGITGSRFQQHTRCKFHHLGLAHGLTYLHNNPVEANLVKHPGEWGYSSFNEYSGLMSSEDCICNIALGKSLLLESSSS
jgi:hypothetical protein